MRQNRQSKMVAILALCVSVVGLTLGFAAFSNTLTISSSATVKPDQKDFKLVAYGVERWADDNSSDIWSPELYSSSTISKVDPFSLNSGDLATDAIISSGFDNNGSNQITISDLKATIKNPSGEAHYWFMIKNEGKYDAYLSKNLFYEIENSMNSIVCTPVVEEGKQPATEAYVNEACKGMLVEISAFDPNGAALSSSEWMRTEDDFIKLNKYVSANDHGYIFLQVRIYYDENAVRADGDFSVEFPEMVLEFTSVEPTV